MLRVGIALVLLVALAGDALAESPHLIEAREAIGNLEYERAKRALARAVRSGDNLPEHLAEIYLWSGVVAGAFDDDQTAFDFFARAVAIEQGISLRSGFAPKITDPFVRARRYIARQGTLKFSCRPGDDAGVAQLVVENDPMGLVEGGRISYRENGERVVFAVDSRDLSFAVPRGVTERVSLYAVDRYGNQVGEVCRTSPSSSTRKRSRDRSSASFASSRVADFVSDSASPPLYKRWYLWGAASATLAATGVYYAVGAAADRAELRRRLADSASYDYLQTKAYEVRGQRRGIAAGVTLSAAAVGGIVAVVLAAKLSDGAPRGSRARAIVVPTRGGAHVGVSLSF